MSEHIVTLRHRQVCDICHRPIEKGERCHLVRDDFWPMMVWFEHCGCPEEPGAPKTVTVTLPNASQATIPQSTNP